MTRFISNSVALWALAALLLLAAVAVPRLHNNNSLLFTSIVNTEAATAEETSSLSWLLQSKLQKAYASSTAATNTIVQSTLSTLSSWQRRRLQEVGDSSTTAKVAQPQAPIHIFTNAKMDGLARKQRQILQNAWNPATVVLTSNSTEEQHAFLLAHPCVEGVAERFEELRAKPSLSPLAEEVWKFCALYFHGGLYLDSDSPVLKASALKQLLWMDDDSTAPQGRNSPKVMAVLMDFFAPSSIHGSLLFLREAQSNVALEMAKLLVNTNIAELALSPLILPRALYDLIQKDVTNSGGGDTAGSTQLHPGKNGHWHILQQSCSEDPFRKQHSVYDVDKSALITSDSLQSAHRCSPQNGFCCLIYTGNDNKRVAVLASRTPTHPVQQIAYSDLPKPFQHAQNNANLQEEDSNTVAEELPFVATMRRLGVSSPETNTSSSATPRVLTFYEKLKEKDCLPSSSCHKCLSDKKNGATCETCRSACPCYCKALCHESELENDNDDSESHQDNRRYEQSAVRKPLYARDPTRLIPRIVHQTWFEDLTPDKYPNMSRLAGSFQSSGWEYKFYTDDQAGAFLEEHFPPQVREAYELLIPGAFKADLFRYCVLLIRGGVYADVDTMMGPSLDAAIPKDVGFMVGLDEPGKKIGKRMCLWNGFLASAPGHPFLAKAIETIVNNILERFTSVDMAAMHCPMPEMSVITSFSPLFVAGPCMLGSTINQVLGRHRQTNFEAGELVHSDDALQIPGRTIILDQNKYDMGAHRFTFLEQNLIVLSTDFPNSDDRGDREHYSDTRIRFTTYGVDSVYKNSERSNGPLIRLTLE